jgi:hypothetical protein
MTGETTFDRTEDFLDEAEDKQDQPTDEDSLDCAIGSDINVDDDVLDSTKSDFNGIRIVNHINSAPRHSYFKIKINRNIMYLHKQSACWLLSSNNTKLSSDRLSQVQQQTFDVD